MAQRQTILKYYSTSPFYIKDIKSCAVRYDLELSSVKRVFQRICESAPHKPEFFAKWTFEKACNCVGPAKSLAIFEKEDFGQLLRRVFLTEYVLDKSTPIYTLPQLAETIYEFQNHLGRQRRHLIETGYPATNFRKSLWLDRNMGTLFPTREATVNPPAHLLHWDEYDVAFDDRYSSLLAGTREIERARFEKANSTTKLLSLFSEQKSFHEPGADGFSRDEYGNVQLSVSFHKRIEQAKMNDNENSRILTLADLLATRNVNPRIADTLEVLTSKQAERIESLRESVMNLKHRVFSLLPASIDSSDPKEVLNVLKCSLKENLKHDEVGFLLNVDGRCYAKPNELLSFGGHANGGLVLLIRLIFDVWVEVKYRLMHDLRDSFENLPLDAVFASYYEVIGKSWRSDLDRILDLAESCDNMRARSWDSFYHQFSSVWGELKESVHLGSVDVANKFAKPYENYVRSLIYSVGRHLSEHDCFPMDSPLSKRDTRDMSAWDKKNKFPFMKGLRWEEVQITFPKLHFMRAIVRGEIRKWHYNELGFGDGRQKGFRPDKAWTALLMIVTRGPLSLEDFDRDRNNISKHTISKLRKRLKQIFQINDDPFHSYWKKHAYIPRFNASLNEIPASN